MISQIPHNRPTLGSLEVNASSSVIHSGWLAQGAEVAHFENEMCQYLGLPNSHAVAVSSGSAALYMALLAASAKNKMVIAPAYSCRSLWNAIELAGGFAKWLDVGLNSPNLDLAAFDDPDAKIIFAVHMFGIPLDIHPSDKFIIEDCSQRK